MSEAILEKVKQHCQDEKLSYMLVKDHVTNLLVGAQIEGYYVSKGYTKENKNTVLDLCLLTKDKFMTYTYTKTGDIQISIRKLSDISFISFEAKNDIIILNTYYGNLTFGLEDKKINSSHLNVFMIKLFELWKKA